MISFAYHKVCMKLFPQNFRSRKSQMVCFYSRILSPIVKLSNLTMLFSDTYVKISKFIAQFLSLYHLTYDL